MKIVLPGEFVTQNEYIKAERIHRQRAAGIKRAETERVAWQVKQLDPVTEYPIDLTVFWYCPNRRKDPDNIAFSIKFILDGLQDGGVLENDGWKQIKSICHCFEIDKANPRVEIFIE